MQGCLWNRQQGAGLNASEVVSRTRRKNPGVAWLSQRQGQRQQGGATKRSFHGENVLNSWLIAESVILHTTPMADRSIDNTKIGLIPRRRVNSPPPSRSPHPAVAPMHPMAPHPHRASVGTNEPTSWLPNPTSMPDPVTFNPGVSGPWRRGHNLSLRLRRRFGDDGFARTFPHNQAAVDQQKSNTDQQHRQPVF